MNTDEVFKALLLETSPERAGRVGYLRRLKCRKSEKECRILEQRRCVERGEEGAAEV